MQVRPAAGSRPHPPQCFSPPWVKSGSLRRRSARPICARKWTCRDRTAWSGSGQQRRFEALMPRTALPCIADFVFAVVSRCFLWCAFFSVEDRHSVQFARPVSNNPQGLNRPGSFFLVRIWCGRYAAVGGSARRATQLPELMPPRRPSLEPRKSPGHRAQRAQSLRHGLPDTIPIRSAGYQPGKTP